MSGLERALRAFAILVLARTRRRICGSARSPTSTTLEGLRGMKGERQVGARLELRARVECCEVRRPANGDRARKSAVSLRERASVPMEESHGCDAIGV